MGYRTLIFLFFCIAGKAIVGVITNDGDNNNGEYFSFEADDEIPEKAIQASLLRSASKKSRWLRLKEILFDAGQHIDFLVYERNNMDNPHLLKFDSTDGSKYLKRECRTVMYIHGWRSKDKFIDKLETANTALDDQNLNLIEVNWKKGSNSLMYPVCAKRVSSVGETVAKFIGNNRKYIDLDKLIIIGHSLGAHVAGYAGKFLKKNHGIIISEIIGLDPAGVGFRNTEEKLQPDDASKVIVFHSSEFLGHFEPLGTFDVYINGGKKQPGMDDFGSHRFSKVFYMDIIGGTKEMIGYRYSSFAEVKAGKIPNFENREIRLFHGEDFPPRGTLIYVGTKDQTPLKSQIEKKKSLKNVFKR